MQPTVDEMNKVIGVFCGFPATKTMLPHFHVNWNWLMHAQRKIVELCIEDGSTGMGFLFASDQYTSTLETVPLGVIEDAHKVIYEFIVWYNEYTLNDAK